MEIDGKYTRGLIVETEAYSQDEKACHGYGGKITERTKTLFEEGGIGYVYLIYGMYNLFNIVTSEKGRGEAVLIRALEPLNGMQEMINRRRSKGKYSLTSGPGKLTIAMGIQLSDNGVDLTGDKIWVEDGKALEAGQIMETTRIGVDYAEEDSQLPWRFYLRNNPWVSKK